MSGKVIWNSLKPQFKTLKPEDSKPENFGKFHEFLALTLTQWFSTYFLPKQIFDAKGVQYIPPNETVFWNENTKLLSSFKFTTTTIPFTKDELIGVFKMKDQSFPTLFALIGTKISLMLNMMICTIPGSTLSAIPTKPYLTAHFKNKGILYVKALSALKFTAEEIKSMKATETIWDLFEDFLIDAINSTNSAIFTVTGTLPPGTFIGEIDAKLSI